MSNSTNKTNFQVAGPIRLPVEMSHIGVSEFKLYIFRFKDGDIYALEKGQTRNSDWLLVRVHSACNLAHIFNSQRCDCQPQLDLALELIHHARKGLLIYIMNHEGRGVGAFDHVRVYEKQDEGFDTVDSYTELGLPVDKRDYKQAGEVLNWFDIKKIRLLTNNPEKIKAMRECGLEIKREPLITELSSYNESQIKAKVKKLGHLIPLDNNH